MTRLKDSTFEGASLTGTNGASSVTGTVTLNSSSVVKNTYSSFHDTAASYLRYDITASGEVFLSAYIYVTAFSNNVRTFYITNGLRLDLRSTGRLRLQTSAGVQIGSDSDILSTNTLYRIGLHYKKGTGSDGIARAYVTATGSPDAAFGTAFAETTALAATVDISRVDVGNTAGATVNTFYVDNIRIDNAAMPTDDVAGGSDTPLAVNVTVNNTISMQRGIAAIKTLAITSTLTFAKGIVSLKEISLAVNSTVSALKNIGKPIIQTVTSTLIRNTVIPKNVLVSVTTILFLQRTIAKTIARTVTSTVSAVGGQLYLKAINIVVNTSSVIQKNILKPIEIIESVLVSLQPKSISKVITTVVASTLTALHGNLVLKEISYIVSTTIVKTVGIDKIIDYIQGSNVSVQKSLALLIEHMLNTTAILSVQKRIHITRIVLVDSILTFSKLVSNELMNTYIVRNVRSITLALKNSALNILGKNIRTINFQDTDES